MLFQCAPWLALLDTKDFAFFLACVDVSNGIGSSCGNGHGAAAGSSSGHGCKNGSSDLLGHDTACEFTIELVLSMFVCPVIFEFNSSSALLLGYS